MKRNKMAVYIWILLVLAFTSTSGTALNAYERQDLLDSPGIVIRVSNITRFIESLENSPPGKLWNSNEMKAFLNNQSLGEALKENILDALTPVESPNRKQLAHLNWEMFTLLKGEIVFGFIPTLKPQNPFKIYMIAAIEEEDFQKSLQLDERIAELDPNTEAPRIHRFQGIPIYNIRTRGEGKETSSWECFYNGTVISARDKEWVERSLIRLKQEAPASPRGVPSLHARITEFFFDKMLNPPTLKPANPGGNNESAEAGAPIADNLQSGPTRPQTVEGSSVPNTGEILKAFGLGDVKYISADIKLNPDSALVEFRVKNKNQDPTVRSRGLWKIIARESVSAKHRLPYIPSDIHTYQVIQLDVNAFWNDLPGILESINPQGAMNFKMVTNMFSQMYKIDLSRDLFANLGTRLTTYSRMEGLARQELYNWQLRDGGAIEKMLAKLMGEGSPLKNQLSGFLDIHDLNGHKLYSIKTPSKDVKPGTEATPAATGKTSSEIGFSIVDNSLVMGTEKLVRNHIQAATSKREESPFYQSDEFGHMSKILPENAAGYSIMDIGRLARPMLEIFKSPMMVNIISMKKAHVKQTSNGKLKSQPSPMEVFLSNLKFENLPSIEFITSFFGKGYGFTLVEGNDIVFRTTITYPVKR